MDRRTPRVLFQANDRLGESPVWLAGNRELVWLELFGMVLHRIREDGSGHRASLVDGCAPAGAIVATEDPGRLIVSRRDGVFLYDRASGHQAPYVHPNASLPDLVYNDAKVDRHGRLWIATSDRDEKEPRGVLYAVENGRARVADAGFAVCNGPAFSIDGRRAYVSDSVRGRILAYDLDDDGILRNRADFLRFAEGEGVPDGLTVDAEDCLWVAHWGGSCISRFGPDGSLRSRIALPVPNVTSLAFGGSDLETLFITTAFEGLSAHERRAAPLAGGLFVVDPGVRGVPDKPFSP